MSYTGVLTLKEREAAIQKEESNYEKRNTNIG